MKCSKCDEAHERGEFGLQRNTEHEAIDADYEPVWDLCPCKCHEELNLLYGEDD